MTHDREVASLDLLPFMVPLLRKETIGILIGAWGIGYQDLQTVTAFSGCMGRLPGYLLEEVNLDDRLSRCFLKPPAFKGRENRPQWNSDPP